MKRLRVKSSPLPAGKVRQVVRRKPARAVGATVLSQVVQGGLVPKARRPFSLFVSSQWSTVEGASRNRMQVISGRWRALTAAERAEWQAKCQDEFAKQRDAAQNLGLRYRTNVPGGGVSSSGGDPQGQPISHSGVICVGSYKCELREGGGTYGLVLQATDQASGRIVVLKMAKTGSNEDLAHELSIYKRLEGTAGERAGLFLNVLNAGLDDPIPWLAFPFVGTNLARHVRNSGPLAGEVAMAAVAQMSAALGHIHSLNIVHLDVKPGNMLWVQATKELRLMDFGMAEVIPIPPGVKIAEAYCAEMYRPPELWTATISRSSLSVAVDAWSLGCSIYEAVTGNWLMPGFASWTGTPGNNLQGAIAKWPRYYQRMRSSPLFLSMPPVWRSLVWKLTHPLATNRPKLQTDGMAWVLRQSADT